MQYTTSLRSARRKDETWEPQKKLSEENDHHDLGPNYQFFIRKRKLSKEVSPSVQSDRRTKLQYLQLEEKEEGEEEEEHGRKAAVLNLPEDT